MEQTRERDGFELGATRRTLPIALLRARERIMEQFRPVLQKHNVTEQQWRVLRVLEEASETHMGELAEATCILAPSLSRMTKALEARALIELTRDPEDGRRTLLKLSPTGAALIRQIAPESAAAFARIEQQVGRDTIETLLELLETLTDNLTGPG